MDTTTAGSATQPCYFSNGKPSACTYSLNKTVPSNAVFTDTTYGIATTSSNGLLRLLSGSTDNFMRADGIWANPISLSYSNEFTSFTENATVNNVDIFKFGTRFEVLFINCDTTSTVTSTYNEYTLMTLPNGYRPAVDRPNLLSRVSVDNINSMGAWINVASTGGVRLCTRDNAFPNARVYAVAFIPL